MARWIKIVAALFTSLYPRVMVSSPDFGKSLTVSNAAWVAVDDDVVEACQPK